MNFENFKTAAQGRKLFIWGSRALGIAAARRLQSLGFEVVGFVDSVKRTAVINSLPVFSDEEFFVRNAPGSCLVLICTQAYAGVISNILLKHNFTRNDYFDYNDLVYLHYYIETNNRCNLKCKTCAVSSTCNNEFHNMELSVFKNIIDRIANEDSLVLNLFLYGNNEPLLSPDLPEKIAYCKEKGFCVGFSSNLTLNVDYKALVTAQPDWVRISLSGWGERYEQMHRGGKFTQLLEHMRLLSSLREQYASEMTVDVIFHRYKHNAEDIPRMKALCEELGFQFSCINAAIIGLDAVSAYLEKRPIPRAMHESLPLLCHSVEELAQKSYAERHQPCSTEKLLRICSDGTMASCQCWIGSVIENANFLTMPLKDIVHALKHSPLCSQCKPKGLHTFYLHVFDESTNED